jgi:putative endonuclease
MLKTGTVYILTNQYNSVLYIGVTYNLLPRIIQHRNKSFPNAFTARYQCNKLVYCQSFESIEEAIKYEKKLKNWKRKWKIELIEKNNPKWNDLIIDFN